MDRTSSGPHEHAGGPVPLFIPPAVYLGPLAFFPCSSGEVCQFYLIFQESVSGFVVFCCIRSCTYYYILPSVFSGFTLLLISLTLRGYLGIWFFPFLHLSCGISASPSPQLHLAGVGGRVRPHVAAASQPRSPAHRPAHDTSNDARSRPTRGASVRPLGLTGCPLTCLP